MRPLVAVLRPGVRARAYLQMMLRAGHRPDVAVLLGTDEDDVTGVGWGLPPAPDFDPTASLRSTLERAEIPTRRVASLDVNGNELVRTLDGIAPSWSVFTGGGILADRTLAAGRRWIHSHPGWLPDHRGSTCLHYALLLEGQVGVSAFVMAPGLDQGPVLCRRRFTAHPHWTAESLDHAADAWMRGCVLVDALRGIAAGLEPEPQDLGRGETFYVIHPVLKHLALLSISEGLHMPTEPLVSSR